MDADDPQLNGPSAPRWFRPWLAWLDLALQQEILRLRARRELSGDELRGLYISDAQVDELVQRRVPSAEIRARLARLDDERRWLLEESRLMHSGLRDLTDRFTLGDTDLIALVLCLAPEVELTYQTLFAYLNDDVGRRLPTVDLCQRLAGGRLDEDGGVLAARLVRPRRLDATPSWTGAGLVLADPVRRFLLDPVATSTTEAGRSPVELPHVLVVEAPVAREALDEAHARAGAAGRSLVALDRAIEDPAHRLADGALEARLRGSALCLSEADLGLGDVGVVGDAESERWTTLLVTEVDLVVWLRTGVADRLPLNGIDHERVLLRPLDLGARTARWRHELTRRGVDFCSEDVDAVALLFALSPAQIAAAAAAVAREGVADREALSRAARAHCMSGLAKVAEMVTPAYEWDDLVLPGQTMRRLSDLAGAIRHRHRVFDTWSFGRLHGGHASIRALFTGSSGTGKTMSAAVLARDLGLDLFRVDLSTVVSKYIGETEKNIERVLAAAEDSNALLLFDEADALFGKRSSVQDAHDRYANIEIAFLLQRIESYDGVLILATNLAGNLDDAFHRRIHFHIEFPLPDQAARERLWRKAIPDSAPTADDVDPAFLAGMFPMTGGEVRSAALLAAFLAANESVPIGMAHLTRALARQRGQQGKLPSFSEFAGFLHLVQEGGG